ncbi:MAG: hypothetical protein ACKV0T_24420 [Planctomycetales bacterium]
MSSPARWSSLEMWARLMNEADTCRKLVFPKLEASGWDGDKHFYSEQTPFTDGRIIVPAGKPRRLKKKFSDFLLRYTRDITLVVVEAKSDKLPAGNGLQQAKDYVEHLDSLQELLPKLTTAQAEVSTEIEAMIPALLGKFFEGEGHRA